MSISWPTFMVNMVLMHNKLYPISHITYSSVAVCSIGIIRILGLDASILPSNMLFLDWLVDWLIDWVQFIILSAWHLVCEIAHILWTWERLLMAWSLRQKVTSDMKFTDKLGVISDFTSSPMAWSQSCIKMTQMLHKSKNSHGHGTARSECSDM